MYSFETITFHTNNINCRDVQRKNVVCRHVKLKGTMTTWSVHTEKHRDTTQKHAEHQDASDIHKTPIFVFFGFLFFNFIFYL